MHELLPIRREVCWRADKGWKKQGPCTVLAGRGVIPGYRQVYEGFAAAGVEYGATRIRVGVADPGAEHGGDRKLDLLVGVHYRKGWRRAVGTMSNDATWPNAHFCGTSSTDAGPPHESFLECEGGGSHCCATSSLMLS